eukprot:6153609-Amphidinium_carterae.1
MGLNFNVLSSIFVAADVVGVKLFPIPVTEMRVAVFIDGSPSTEALVQVIFILHRVIFVSSQMIDWIVVKVLLSIYLVGVRAKLSVFALSSLSYSMLWTEMTSPEFSPGPRDVNEIRGPLLTSSQLPRSLMI